MTGLEALAQRIANGEVAFRECVQQIAGVGPEDANDIFRIYLKLKVAKRDGYSGVVRVTHGAYMQAKPMLRALAIAKGPAKKHGGSAAPAVPPELGIAGVQG